MLTTSNPQFGHFLVRKMEITEQFLCFQSHTGKSKYGVFRIDHKTTGFPDGDNVNTPKDTNKVHLTPVGDTNFLERDWYVCDVLRFDEHNAGCQVFDNYYEALNWAESMNNIK